MVELNSLQSSNVWKYIGIEIVENEQQQRGVQIKNTDNLKQVYGNVHGGIIAMAIDAAMGVAVNEAIGPDQSAVTVELKVNYLRPVFNSDLFAFAKLVKQGKQLITGTVEVHDEENHLIAIGSSTFIMKANLT
jgi:acyl-CoA thioesterase